MNRSKPILTILAIFLLFVSCDQKTLKYKTYQKAKEANLFEKGWIPKEIVDKGIGDIFLKSNLDLNTCIFSYNNIKKSYNFDLYNNLINPEIEVDGISIPTWWNRGIRKCQKFGQVKGTIFALDTTKRILYGWRTNNDTINYVGFDNIITKNRGKYPYEINLFEDNNIAERLKKLTKDQYADLVNNFNVQSPITYENSIYKLTGCKQHNCPCFFTTILFDASNDNFNVIIDRDGDIQDFCEKGKINLTQSLKNK